MRGNEFIIGDLNGAPGDSCSFNLEKDGVGSEFNGGQSFSDFIDVWQKVYGCNFAEAVRDISNKFAIYKPEIPAPIIDIFFIFDFLKTLLSFL